MVQREDFRLDSEGIPLSATLFVPPGQGPYPGLVVCHGMPAGPRPDPGGPDAAGDGLDYPGLAEWCAWEGFATLIFNFRGTGESGGNFHTLGWARDLDAVVSWMLDRPEVDPARVVLLGSSLGAAVAIYVAAHRPEVAGLVSFAGPSVMGPRSQPAEAVERLRAMGLIRDPDFPPSLEEWANEGATLNPVDWVGLGGSPPTAAASRRRRRRGVAGQRAHPLRARRRGQRDANAAGRRPPLPQRGDGHGRGAGLAQGEVYPREIVEIRRSVNLR